MKWLCFIFALFFLSMDLEPCKDKLGVAVGNPVAISTGNHQRNNQTQDQCPPLCHCGCCSMQVVMQKIAVLRRVEGVIVEQKTPITSEKPVTRPANIWQPPKLVA